MKRRCPHFVPWYRDCARCAAEQASAAQQREMLRLLALRDRELAKAYFDSINRSIGRVIH